MPSTPVAGFLDALRDRPLIADGAMGTMLLASLPPETAADSPCLEHLNLTAPEVVQNLHEAYRDAGAEILQTNSFGANALRLARHGLQQKVAEMNRAAVRLARAAAASCYVAGSVGPLGVAVKPLGPIPPIRAREIFRTQMEALAEAGADLIVLETFQDWNEIREALAAATALGGLPVVAQFSPDASGALPDGTPVEALGSRLADWGADVVGLNCGTGPLAMLEPARRMVAISLPVSVQPSAGLPARTAKGIQFPADPEIFAAAGVQFASAGVRIIGGCCGTTPQHIRALRQERDRLRVAGAAMMSAKI